ncbi:hypothetical protein [Methylobacterium oryzisoli]|uniref:hypothetical protein n=1 Tax=Methylobacterium oryzisoli TaxID=3385502 RepID=UPI003892452F
MRPSPAKRRKAAIARARVSVSGTRCHGDTQDRVSRRDAVQAFINAQEQRGRGLYANARQFLISARSTDFLARKHGFRIPGIA